MIVYFDSSALAKQYLAEPDSDRVADLLRRASAAGTSLISRAEVAAALAKAVRMNWVRQAEGIRALLVFRKQWQEFVGVEVTEAVVIWADSLAWDYGLRGYDAVHLASALTWQESMADAVTVATFDQQLWEAAQKAGLTAWPESLGSTSPRKHPP